MPASFSLARAAFAAVAVGYALLLGFLVVRTVPGLPSGLRHVLWYKDVLFGLGMLLWSVVGSAAAAVAFWRAPPGEAGRFEARLAGVALMGGGILMFAVLLAIATRFAE